MAVGAVTLAGIAGHAALTGVRKREVIAEREVVTRREVGPPPADTPPLDPKIEE